MVMNETEKPFVCTKMGCNMAFTNEDHLTVHQKKHDMNLQLGIEGQNGTIADQTPTPTRFIRNCEEVGLFQDLQNVNPFDETFQKATEMAKSGAIHVPETATDDSLHTPHILPHIEENNSIKYVRNNSNELEFTVTTIDESLLNEEPDNDQIEVLSLYDSDSDTSMVLVTECDPVISSHSVTRTKKCTEEPLRQVEEQMQPSDEIQNILTKENNDTEVKVKLKHAIKRKMQKDETDLNKREVIFIYEPAENVTNLTPHSTKDTSNPSINLLERKREVNRAAQFRSRLKKKSWIKQMENEVNKLREENRDVKNENRVLKNEIIWLKAILLYHKDCPVSKDPKKMQEITEIAKMAQEDQDQMDRLRNIRPKPSLPNLAPAVLSAPLVNHVVNSTAPVTSGISPAGPVITHVQPVVNSVTSTINSVPPLVNPSVPVISPVPPVRNSVAPGINCASPVINPVVNTATNPILISVPPAYSTSASFVQTPIWNPGQFCPIFPKPNKAYQSPLFPKPQNGQQAIVIQNATQPSPAPVAILQKTVISSEHNSVVTSPNFTNVNMLVVEKAVKQLERLDELPGDEQATFNIVNDKELIKSRKPLHLRIETPEVIPSEVSEGITSGVRRSRNSEPEVLDLSKNSRLKRGRKQKLQVRIESTNS